MFIQFFYELRDIGVPVTLREYLLLLEALQAGLADYSVEGFYFLARTSLVKDERFFDRYDLAFANCFQGFERLAEIVDGAEQEIPEEWLKRLAEKHLSTEEMAKLKKIGDWQELMKKLRERLAEQKERHQGGSKWLGTAGTSPFGAYGYNPMGIRIGQHESRHRKAIKVWDKREFKNFADDVELGTRTIKMVLRRLRRFGREGAETELDLDGTIQATAENAGQLELKMRPERHNRVKVILLLDVGGSMDDHVMQVEELFSACRMEFKHLEVYYFHNCLYDYLWRDNDRRNSTPVKTWDLLHTYDREYDVIVVGDASMSPYEIVQVGGAIEYFNQESGEDWIRRFTEHFHDCVWLNPIPQQHWEWTASIGMLRELFAGRMFPLTLLGMEQAIANLND